MALVVLAALTTLCLQFFAAASDQRRQVFAQLTATQEAANLLERAEALEWNDLTPAKAAKLQLSAPARQTLPEARAEVRGKHDGTRHAEEERIDRIGLAIFVGAFMKSIILVDAQCYDANGNVFGSAFTPELVAAAGKVMAAAVLNPGQIMAAHACRRRNTSRSRSRS